MTKTIQILLKYDNNRVIYQGEHSSLLKAIESVAKNNIVLKSAYLAKYPLVMNKKMKQTGALKGVNAENGIFENSCFDGQDLTNANFNGAKLANVSFDRAILKNVSFKGADISKASFKFADIDGIKIDGALYKNDSVKSLHNIPFFIVNGTPTSILLLHCEKSSFILLGNAHFELNDYLTRIENTQLYYNIIGHIYSLKMALKTKISKHHKHNYKMHNKLNKVREKLAIKPAPVLPTSIKKAKNFTNNQNKKGKKTNLALIKNMMKQKVR